MIDARSEVERYAETAWVRACADVRREEEACLQSYLRTGEVSYVWPELRLEAERRKAVWLEQVRISKLGGLV